MDRGGLMTEKRLAASAVLDAMSPMQIVELMNAEDRCVVDVVGLESANIALRRRDRHRGFSEPAVACFMSGLAPVAGSGVLDAAECPPTFRTDPCARTGYPRGRRAGDVQGAIRRRRPGR